MAKLYDRLMQDAPYDQWLAFTNAMIEKNQLNDDASILDLGCGTGQITCRLAEQGYKLTGVDLSEEMLVEASNRAYQQHLTIQWVQQDMTTLAGFANYDLVISYCDVINYIIGENALRRVFNSAYQALKTGGLFIFDVHSLAHVENHLTNQVFSEVYDDLAYVWFCHPGQQLGEMDHDLTFFIKEQQHYQRFDEQHHQRTYPVDFYLSLLKAVGFTMVECFEDFATQPTQSELITSADRIFFVCHK